ncbi:methyl-accepting chemotaxis protein, partial [Dickeya solani]|nr:methyl-accepting chemotaxis protein [Dickeya solani]MBJ2354557.1 methyl-accepting chemotaxis protein [Dickeya solani]
NSLEEQAQMLEHAVSVFRLGNDNTPPRAGQRTTISTQKPSTQKPLMLAKSIPKAATAAVNRAPAAHAKDDWESF